MLKNGETRQLHHHDFAFSASGVTQGQFLMCAHGAVSDLEVEADVTGRADDIPVQNIETKVKGIEALDDQVARLHLQTPRSQRLRFTSGQSVTLSVGDDVQTRLALASCPCDDRDLQFHVPKVPGEAFSEMVFEGHLRPRDRVGLRGPEGSAFVLDETDARPSLIFCWHTGFAPAISLVEHAMSLDIEKEIRLFRFSPTPTEHYLPTLGRSWADAFDTISVTLMADRITLLSSPQACADVLSAVVAEIPGLRDFNTYTAGPPNFVEAARQVFAARGLPEDQIRTHTDWLGVFD